MERCPYCNNEMTISKKQEEIIGMASYFYWVIKCRTHNSPMSVKMYEVVNVKSSKEAIEKWNKWARKTRKDMEVANGQGRLQKGK